MQNLLQRLAKFHWAIPVLCALVFVTLGAQSISYMSPTYDESKHLVRGIMLLETRNYRLNKHHPVFTNVLNALPAVANPKLKVPSIDTPEWKRADKDAYAKLLETANGGIRQYTQNILNPSRLVTIIGTAILGFIIYLLIQHEFGVIPAIVSTVLYFFSPNIIANSTLVTTDGWIIPIFFISTFLLYRYVKHRKTIDLIGFGIVAFISLITKYNTVPFAFLWLVILFIEELRHNLKEKGSKVFLFTKAFAKPIAIAASWLVLLFAVYGFRFSTLASTNYTDTALTKEHLDNISYMASSVPSISKSLQHIYTSVKLPFPEYIQGFFSNVLVHDVYGHDSYLYGMYTRTGWWYYFPLAMLVKFTVTELLGIAVLLIAGIYLLIKNRKNIKALLVPELIFLIIPLAYFLLSLSTNINLGIRHVLVVLPFIFLGIGILAEKSITNKRWTLFIFIPLILWQILTSVLIYPNYLEYINEPAGGPKNGYKYLLDSNIYWGQGNLLIEDFIKTLPKESKVYVNPMSGKEITQGYVIMDVNILFGLNHLDRDKTAWLRNKYLSGEIKPQTRIANTIFVFKLEEKASH